MPLDSTTTGFRTPVNTTSNKFLVGFPWFTSIVTYTVSWVWIPMLPSALFWDDWAYVFNRPSSYLNEIFSRTGLPPWRALIDSALLDIGSWTLRWMTFVMFFGAGLFLFEILRKISFLSLIQCQRAVLVFLIFPVNHARIALVMFGYTTSFFLFFLGWMLLVRYSGFISLLSAWICFIWSFMTHSFLFFYVLPVLHFAYLRRRQPSWEGRSLKVLTQLALFAGAPILYLVLRTLKWPPDAEYAWYHTVFFRAVIVATVFLLPFMVSTIGIGLWNRYKKQVPPTVLTAAAGLLAFGVGVFPYISSGNLDSRMIFYFWELDWTSRHQLLMPLGGSLLVVATINAISEERRRSVFVPLVAAMVIVNAFWGVGAYVDSLKKDELEELLSLERVTDRYSSYVFVDETKRFNFRGSSYREYEFVGHLAKAGVVAVSAVEGECREATDSVEITIKSDKNLMEAFLSGNLGVRLETRPCNPS